MNQRWRQIALWILPIGVALLLVWQLVGSGALNNLRSNSASTSGSTTVAPRNAAVARMSYGRFLDYVAAGRVTAVDIFTAAPEPGSWRQDACPARPAVRGPVDRSRRLH